MSKKLNKCSMPNCHTYTDKGKRLCKKHAASGKDLRIPIYVLELGLDRIYETIQKQKKGFSVEVLLDILDPGYKDRLDGINCKNGMAKLLRSLRANGYLTKRGRFNGFVVYDLAQGWDQSGVTIEDEPVISTTFAMDSKAALEALENKLSNMEDKLLKKDKQLTSLAARLQAVTDKASNIEKEFIVFLKMQKNITTSIQEQVCGLTDIISSEISSEQKQKNNKNIEKLEETIAEIQAQLTDFKLGDNTQCPIAKLREQMHVIFGGKRSETRF